MTEDSSITSREFDDDFYFENNQINFEELFNKILRRKKIFLLFFEIIFTLSFMNLLYRRIAHPVYRGAFTIMISDPIIDKNRDSSSGAIENLAMNRAEATYQLIQYLKSPKVLEKVAAQNNISPVSLSNQISIIVPRTPGALNAYLPSTLRVAINGKNKVILKNILDDLSQTYLQIAFERKSKNLLDGIAFLDNEQPKLLKKSNQVQTQLEEFRLKNKLIDPLKEGDF